MRDSLIGPYRILDIMGQGGMATVYKAHHEADDRYVAIKLLSSQLSQDPRFLKRFDREARVVSKLNHASIVPIYEYGDHEGQPYIVMQLVEGGTLRGRIFYDTLDLPIAVHIITQIADALDHAHDLGIIHRDLKPSNILLDQNDKAYLTDFGIAKMLGSSTQITASGVIGTPSYMSPEQCQGKEMGPPGDIYALGAIIYETITGKPPFVSDTPLSVMYMHVQDPVPSIHDHNPSLPTSFDVVIRKAMDKQPILRYPTARALADAFRAAAIGDVDPSHSPSITPHETQPAIEFVAGEIIDDGEPVHIHTIPRNPIMEEPAAIPPIPQPRASTTTVISAVGVGIVLLLAAGIIGLLVTSAFRSGGAADDRLLPSLRPPTETAIVAVAMSDTPEPVTPAGIIESDTATAPLTDTPQPTATTQAATSIPASTNTPAPPTNTPLPTATPTQTNTPAPSDTPTMTATLTPTATSTPALTGASGSIAYTAGEGLSAEIMIVDANGLNPRQLTNNSYYDGEPDWSPDGSRIAFEVRQTSNGDIYIMNADGTGLQQITDSADTERHPDWSPDGTQILYEVGDGDSTEIYIMDADGGNKTRITDNDYAERAPQFSPDGTQFAVMAEISGGWQIAIISISDGEPVKIFDCPAPDCRFPTWSPDGTKIANNLLDANGNATDVVLLDIASGLSSVLVSGGENGRAIWSVDGKFIFLNRTLDGNTDLYRYVVGSGVIERMTAETIVEYGPDWSP